jgi:hypothetical protein
MTDRAHLEAIFKERFERCVEKIEALEKAVAERFRSFENAARSLAESMDKRLVGMNEIRATLIDQNAEFARKPEVAMSQQAMEAQIRTLRESIAGIPSKGEIDAWREKAEADIRQLREQSARAQGLALGLGAIGTIIGILAVVIQWFKN